MRSHSTPVIFLFPLIFLASGVLPAGAQVLSSKEITTLSAVCNGLAPPFPVLTGRSKLLLTNAEGEVHAAHALLPGSVRANSLNSTGAVACLAETDTEIGTCNYGPLFGNIPRIRRDFDLTVYSVEDIESGFLNATIPGTSPPTCANAGTIDSSVTAITGSLPATESVLAALAGFSLDAHDPDGDGYSNLEEFIQGTNMTDATSPGMEISVTANHSKNLVIAEGEAITLSISLNPGQHLKEHAHYYLFADSLSGMFAYFYPKRFEPVETKQASASGRALHFDDFPIITLPALGVGEYEFIFEVAIDGQDPLRASAAINVIPNDWQFTEVSESAGLEYRHGFAISNTGSAHDRRTNSAGVAAGDYDNDGWVDLYVVRGTLGANLLFRNLGDGSFEETGTIAGVDLSGRENAAATFADVDGDNWLDLIVTGINGTQITLFHNEGDGTFSDITDTSGITEMDLSYGASFADIDRDGDLDLWINHWLFTTGQGYLWRNNGNGTFTDISSQAGIPEGLTADFTTNFADINSDGWPDLLIAGDYGTSQVFTNDGDGTFTLATSPVITDENGMGSAVEDYDNDGDLDWFVTSIYDYRTHEEYPWGITGNRFYRNDGAGNFTDVTDQTGTRIGHWGWGACFADFNNDGLLDLFHVNGYSGGGDAAVAPFLNDASPLFIADNNGGFQERSMELGLIDKGQGRGIVCFDYDRDGDIDVFVANNRQPPALYRNDLIHDNQDQQNANKNYLHVRLAGENLNSQAIGARIYLTANGITQMRELRAGSNYLSQNPVESYFGLGASSQADLIRVVWPSGSETVLEDIEANQLLYITHPDQ